MIVFVIKTAMTLLLSVPEFLNQQDELPQTYEIPQIFNCPYQGLTRQIYLESKVLELVALRLEQAIADNSKSDSNLMRRGVSRLTRQGKW